jgi:UDP-N-acetyl-D-glucosamine dehydrogenase
MQLLDGKLIGKRIQIAGIAYKPNVKDLRESPAILLIEHLEELGAEVIWHDPVVMEWRSQPSFPLDTNLDLGLIVTPHKVIDFSVWQNSKLNVLDLSANSNNYGWPKFI